MRDSRYRNFAMRMIPIIVRVHHVVGEKVSSKHMLPMMAAS